MLSDEEKAHVLERLQFEAEIRKQVSEPKAPSKFAWLESKVGLLLLGSALSGILIPVFQYTQETIKWKRQNRYENTKYRLGMMREGMKEFVFVHAYVAEALERTRPFLDSPALTTKEIEQNQSQLIEMQNRRFQQNARFASFLIFFLDRDRGNLRKTYNDYLSAVENYLSSLRRVIQIRSRLLQALPPAQSIQMQEELSRLRDKIDSNIEILNQGYENVLQIMKQQIGGSEDETERYM